MHEMPWDGSKTLLKSDQALLKSDQFITNTRNTRIC